MARFTEGAWRAGIRKPGWHTGAAVADVERRREARRVRGGLHGRQRADPRLRVRLPCRPLGRARPALPQRRRHRPVSDLPRGRSRCRARAPRLDHGLGASFIDVDANGRADLYVANDLDPNRLYLNVACTAATADCPLGFRFVERGRAERVDDPNAGMGVAVGDYSGDGLDDLFVTNSRGQLHAAYRSRAVGAVRGCAAGLRRARSASAHRVGRDVGRPRPRRQPRARDRERRDSRSRASPRTPSASRS